MGCVNCIYGDDGHWGATMPTTVTTHFLTSHIPPGGHKVLHAPKKILSPQVLDDFALAVGLQHKQFELIASVWLLSSTLTT